jgi:large subunit ribosomal protein L10
MNFGMQPGFFWLTITRLLLKKSPTARDLRKEGIHFIVVKNTLAREAANRVGKSALSSHFKGPTAVAITKKDVAVPAKLIRDFQKVNKDLLSVKVAMVDGSIFNANDV